MVRDSGPFFMAEPYRFLADTVRYASNHVVRNGFKNPEKNLKKTGTAQQYFLNDSIQSEISLNDKKAEIFNF